MAKGFKKWLHRKDEPHAITLEEVEPLHPNDYPAKHLKEMLDHRRADFEDRVSQPTGMPTGPGPLS